MKGVPRRDASFGIGTLDPVRRPTLGAASELAAQCRDLGQVTLTMSAFALGTALSLLLLGLLSREALTGWRGRLLSAGRGGNVALGSALVGSGVVIFFGLDKALEAELVKSSCSGC